MFLLVFVKIGFLDNLHQNYLGSGLLQNIDSWAPSQTYRTKLSGATNQDGYFNKLLKVSEIPWKERERENVKLKVRKMDPFFFKLESREGS